jgi:predicted Rossmann-fold nucleotide-binding protein
MGREYWQPLMDFLYKMVDEGMINPEDPDLIFFTDDIDDAVAHIQRHAIRQYDLRKKTMPRSISLLGEKTIIKPKN